MQFPYFKISDRIKTLSEKAEQLIKPAFDRINEITEYNQQKVLAAFIKNKITKRF